MPRAGRCGHRPLQTFYGFASVHSCLRVRTAGRTGSSAPTGAYVSALVRSNLHRCSARAGQAPPLRYDELFGCSKSALLRRRAGGLRNNQNAPRSKSPSHRDWDSRGSGRDVWVFSAYRSPHSSNKPRSSYTESLPFWFFIARSSAMTSATAPSIFSVDFSLSSFRLPAGSVRT